MGEEVEEEEKEEEDSIISLTFCLRTLQGNFPRIPVIIIVESPGSIMTAYFYPLESSCDTRYTQLWRNISSTNNGKKNLAVTGAEGPHSPHPAAALAHD